MKKDIILVLTSLVHGKNQLHYSIPAANLGIEKELKILGDAEVDLLILKSGDKLLLDGMVNFRAELICSSCAETFTKNYSEPIHAEYIKHPPKLGRSVLLTPDEVDRSYFQGETSLGEAARLTKQDTRHYAKRQVSWFQKMAGVTWLPAGENDRLGAFLEERLTA